MKAPSEEIYSKSTICDFLLMVNTKLLTVAASLVCEILSGVEVENHHFRTPYCDCSPLAEERPTIGMRAAYSFKHPLLSGSVEFCGCVCMYVCMFVCPQFSKCFFSVSLCPIELIFARDSICCKRAYAIAIPSVCLSVCLSVRHTGGSVKNG